MDEHAKHDGSRSGIRLEAVRTRVHRNGATEGRGDVEGLSDQSQKRIGIHLRAMYDTIVQQPVPDRFRDLIAQLDSLDGKAGSGR